jgi:predicted Zn-dependent peptidase
VALYDEPYRSLDELLALVDAVDAEAVSAVAGEFFAPTRQTVLSLGPGTRLGNPSLHAAVNRASAAMMGTNRRE